MDEWLILRIVGYFPVFENSLVAVLLRLIERAGPAGSKWAAAVSGAFFLAFHIHIIDSPLKFLRYTIFCFSTAMLCREGGRGFLIATATHIFGNAFVQYALAVVISGK